MKVTVTTSLCLLILNFNSILFAEAEFKICSTLRNSAECKKIEASRTEVKCIEVEDSVDCILKLQKNQVDFGTFTPEEALLASNFLNGTADVIAEIRHPDYSDHDFAFQTVAVVKSNYSGGLTGFTNAAYCHPGFSRAQYWTDQVLKDFEHKVLDANQNAVPCTRDKSTLENEVHRLSKIFRKGCRPGQWSVNDWWDKRLKKEYSSLCSQCDHPSSCAYAAQNKGDHYAALRCLTHGNGDVAYTALSFAEEYFNLRNENSQSSLNASDYRFLCENGTTQDLTSPNVCSWVKQPWTAVIAMKTISYNISTQLKTWLPSDSPRSDHWASNLRSLITKDKGELKILNTNTMLTDYIKRGRNIPTFESNPCLRIIRWCTVNAREEKKCEIIKTAAKTHGIPTELKCVRAEDKQACMNKIKENQADIVFIDSDLGFSARKVYNLTTAAYLETERTGNYYGVAVVKKGSVKNFKDLKDKRACFPKYNGLGWLSFVNTVKNLSLVPNKLCSDTRMVWEFFSEACAPGATNLHINPLIKLVPDEMCAACKGTKDNNCRASADNPYFGEIGALRCLNNGDGDVAFLDFHQIKKFLSSDRHNTSDSNIDAKGLSILCRDGTISDFNLEDPDHCSITQLNGGEVVTRNNLQQFEKRDISNTLLELDDWFGTTSRRYDPVLRMYEPFDGKTDVLFKESAVGLVSAYEQQNRFVNNYVQLLNAMEHCYKESSSSMVISSVFMVFLSVFIILFDKN